MSVIYVAKRDGCLNVILRYGVEIISSIVALAVGRVHERYL